MIRRGIKKVNMRLVVELASSGKLQEQSMCLLLITVGLNVTMIECKS